jgi:hypothetical protein
MAPSVVLIAGLLGAGGATAQPRFGALTGLIVDAAKTPIGGATITAAQQDGSAVRGTISGSDGVYSFADMVPGTYSVIAQAPGLPDVTFPAVQVIAGRAARADLTIGPSTAPLPGLVSSAAPAAIPQGTVARVPSINPQTANAAISDSLWKRWLKGEHLTMQDLESPAPLTASVHSIPAGPATSPSEAPSIPDVTPLPTRTVPADPPTSPPASPPAPAPQQAAPPAPSLPDALQAPPAAPAVDNDTPFAYGDFTWLNGTPRNKDTVLDTKFFTPEIRFDTHYMEDFNQPLDHTIVGATESFRSGEVQIEQASVGGDFHWENVRGRILFMFGLFATTTPRNDASFGVGQWNLRDAYKYVSEAYGGYHFNVNHGLNVDAGIFVSYIGLFSYYNYDNWTYQPSYVSSNTPWFFNGVRVQWFPTHKLKIEPWFINGWQSYAKYNGHPGLGGQLLWEPKEWFKLVANQYGYGQDNLGLPHTERIHTDDSILIRYYHNSESTGISKMAFSLTADAGCQYGGGIQCTGAPSKNKESFVGWMLYNRIWFHRDLLGLTLGGGEMSNWGRYLTLLPPINGADAVTGSPYFTQLPGQRAHMWDSTVTLQYMPKQYITWFAEVGYRHSDIPYFAGRGGVTPPGFQLGGTNGAPGQFACMSGAPSGASDLPTATTNCAGSGGVWFPDLRRSEAKASIGVMVKF